MELTDTLGGGGGGGGHYPVLAGNQLIIAEVKL